MSRPHVLFPDHNPPAFSDGTLEDGILWMIAVMDAGDPSKRFVVSVYSHFLNYGEVSPKQFASLKKVLANVSAKFHDGALKCQGFEPVPADAILEIGKVVQLRAVSNDGGEVFE